MVRVYTGAGATGLVHLGTGFATVAQCAGAREVPGSSMGARGLTEEHLVAAWVHVADCNVSRSAPAVVALKHFVEKHGNDARNIKAKPGAASRVQVMTKRMMEREREYWHTMGNVVSEKGVKVWQALERALARYLSLLKKRDGDLKAVESMQEQNKELRALLGQYLSSKVNEELQLPPAHIL